MLPRIADEMAALLEEELAAAIATLKESTTAIERHVESLEGLHLPHPFKRKPDRRERAAQDLVTSIGRKDGLEFQRLWFDVSSRYRARHHVICGLGEC